MNKIYSKYSALGLVSLLLVFSIIGFFRTSKGILSNSDVFYNSKSQGSSEYSQQDTLPPEIIILSPNNRTYPATVWYCGLDTFELSFKINKPVVWIGYSLDGEENITIQENTTVDTAVSKHYVTVYANDTSGNMGASETVFFTIKSFPPSSTTDAVTTKDFNSTTANSSFGTNFSLIMILICLIMLSYMKRDNKRD